MVHEEKRVPHPSFDINTMPAMMSGEKNTPNNDHDELFFFTWKDFISRNFFISGPWSFDYYYTVRGTENFHIYLWIAKDLAWSENWYWPAMIFGSGALAWCFVLLSHAIHARNLVEIYMWVATVLWLSGNFVWMAGKKYIFLLFPLTNIPQGRFSMVMMTLWFQELHI